MANPQALDIARVISALAVHLPGLTVVAARGLGSEWAFVPGGSTLWVEDARPRVWANRVLAGLEALARHHGLPWRTTAGRPQAADGTTRPLRAVDDGTHASE